MRRVILISGILLVIISLVLAGCSGSSSSTALTAKDILGKSYDNMQAVNSFHFALVLQLHITHPHSAPIM